MTTHVGGCHCGKVRFQVSGEPQHVTICHCSDCRSNSGAPMVSWAAFPEAQFEVLQGTPVEYQSSTDAVRSFCGTCGTGLAYRNEVVLPGLVDIQTATLDDPEALVPSAQIQTAERLRWMAGLTDMPAFERYPGQ